MTFRILFRLYILGVMLQTDVSLCQSRHNTISNEEYGFTVQVPVDWTAEFGHKSDPFPDMEAFLSGKAGIDGGIGDDDTRKPFHATNVP